MLVLKIWLIGIAVCFIPLVIFVWKENKESISFRIVKFADVFEFVVLVLLLALMYSIFWFITLPTFIYYIWKGHNEK